MLQGFGGFLEPLVKMPAWLAPQTFSLRKCFCVCVSRLGSRRALSFTVKWIFAHRPLSACPKLLFHEVSQSVPTERPSEPRYIRQ